MLWNSPPRHVSVDFICDARGNDKTTATPRSYSSAPLPRHSRPPSSDIESEEIISLSEIENRTLGILKTKSPPFWKCKARQMSISSVYRSEIVISPQSSSNFDSRARTNRSHPANQSPIWLESHKSTMYTIPTCHVSLMDSICPAIPSWTPFPTLTTWNSSVTRS